MSKRTRSSIAGMLSVAAVALVIASCGIEAAEQQASKTPAEEIAERFSEPAASPEKLGQPQAQIDAARQKSEAARKSADEAKRIAATKRAEEKVRKDAIAAAAIRAAEQAKADETEMLTQARAEAEERRAAMEATRSEHEKSELAGTKSNAVAEAEQAKLAAERKAQEAAAKAYEAQKQAARQAEEKLISDAKTQAAERERIAEEQKQAEIKAAEAKRSAEAKAVAEARAQAAERERVAEEQKQAEIKAAEAKRSAEARAVAERERVADEQKQAEMKALEARRDAEAKLLAERLRLAEAAREAKAAEAARQATTPAIVAPASRPGAAPAAVDTVPSVAGTSPTKPRVAILILMDAGNKGIRRFEKTADPILCMKDACYISEGNDAPARLMSKARALGIGNTWGARAGACQHSLGCVFRDVDLFGTGGVIQPVDMKVMVHDRRESRAVDVDSDCRIDGGRISCRKPISANGYRMWVVPEPIAAKAGGAALDSAVREGLPQSTNASILPH